MGACYFAFESQGTPTSCASSAINAWVRQKSPCGFSDHLWQEWCCTRCVTNRGLGSACTEVVREVFRTAHRRSRRLVACQERVRKSRSERISRVLSSLAICDDLRAMVIYLGRQLLDDSSSEPESR